MKFKQLKKIKLKQQEMDLICQRAVNLIYELYDNDIEDTEMCVQKFEEKYINKLLDSKKFAKEEIDDFAHDLDEIRVRLEGLYNLVENFANPTDAIIATNGTWPGAWEALKTSNPELQQSKQNDKYQIVFKDKTYPDLLSLRKIPKKIFELLIDNNIITKDNFQLFGEYLKTDKNDDNDNYQKLTNKKIKSDLYIKVQWQNSAIKNLMSKLQKYDIKIKKEAPFPKSCGVYQLNLNKDADLSIFGEYKTKITENNGENIVLYVGSSNDINKRINNAHLYSVRTSALRRSIAKLFNMELTTQENGKKSLSKPNENKITTWIKQNCHFEYETTENLAQARELENQRIFELKPFFNKRV